MIIINDLHQLIRENYDKIAEMPGKRGNIDIKIGDDRKWATAYYKSSEFRISIHRNFTTIDNVSFTLPFNEQLWTDFYNELKEVIND